MNRFVESMKDADDFVWNRWIKLLKLLGTTAIANILTILATIALLLSIIFYPIVSLFIWPPKTEN